MIFGGFFGGKRREGFGGHFVKIVLELMGGSKSFCCCCCLVSFGFA